MIPIGEPQKRLNKHASSWNSERDLVRNSIAENIDTKNMSYRYKDTPSSQPSSLPRRYFSLPKNYSAPTTNNSKDSTHSTRYRSISSTAAPSSTTPSTQSLRYGSLRTYGTSTNTSLTDDVKKPTSRRSGTSSLNSRSVGVSSIPRKSSLPPSGINLRDPTPSYSARHVSSIPQRTSGSSPLGTESNWIPGGAPIRQRSSITLRETKPVWGPEGAPVRQQSSSSLRDSPFTLPTRRTYSTSQGYSDSETRTSSSRRSGPGELLSTRPISPSNDHYKDYSTSETQRTSPHRKLSPIERTSTRRTSPPTDQKTSTSGILPPAGQTTSTRRISPPTVYYEGSRQLKSEKPASPTTSPTVVYSGSLPHKESPSSRSEASTTSSSRRGSASSGSQGVPSDNDDELESSAARDISLLSREIASVYEGSLTRSDSRNRRKLLQKQESTEGKSSKENAKLEKQLSTSEKKISKSGKSSQEQSPGGNVDVKFKKSHKRSASTGSTGTKDEHKIKPGRKVSGFFSRKKSRESTDSEDEEERLQGKGSGFFSRKDSKDSVKDSPTQRGSTSSSHSLSPPLTSPKIPKRKISGPGRLFSFSSDSKTTPEMPKKFSVPGKYFASKDSAKSGGESSDLESETSRTSQPHMKRRVSLPGILGLPRSSSAERQSGGRGRSPEPLVDPAILKRRRSNFKKAQSFDVQSDKAKNSMLSKLKFWDHTKKDKSPDSRYSTSPEDGRSRSISPGAESSTHKNSTEEESEIKTSQARKSRERTVKRNSSLEKDDSKIVPSSPVKPDKSSASSGDKTLQVSPKETHSAKEDDSVKKTLKEPKVHYVGPVDTPASSELRERKQAQYKVNSVEKPASENTTNATENSTNSKDTEALNANKVEVKPLDGNGGSTRDTVSKLRERRRRRREERERFFAGLEPASNTTNTTKEATQKDDVLVEPKNLKTDTTVVAQDKIDGGTISANNKLVEEKNEKVSTERKNSKEVERIPKLGVVGKRSTVDNIVQKVKVKNGKPRYQTIASSVHADIIADLIREKGIKTTTNNEVKIPSVAELRSKFLISKDDNKVTPPRPMVRLEDRPHSICGEVLSPTEMRKFEDITFSLAKKVSSDDLIKTKEFSDSSNDSLPKLDTQWKTISVSKNEKNPPSSPSDKSASKKEKKVNKVTKEENKVKEGNQVKEERDLSPETDTLKKRRGSKKKRKKSIFGSDKDKEPKTPEEDVDLPQHGAVSAAIKAMFTRRPSTTDKIKMSRKQRSKTEPPASSENTVVNKSVAESRERKKSAPASAVVRKSPEVDAQPVKVEKKDGLKDQKIIEKKEEVKDLEKENEKDIELQPISELEQKAVKERKSLKKRKYITVMHKCINHEISPFSSN